MPQQHVPSPKKRDYHLPCSRHRLSVPLGNQLLACTTNIVPPNHSMVLTPQMQKVKHGRETKLNNEPIWDCTLPAGQCYKSWLDVMGTLMLVGSSREGKRCGSLHTGLDQFRRPQTTSMHNIDDIECHMPSRTSFPATTPFAKHVGEKWWYTTIRLGRDGQGRLVKEMAHRLIAAARYGVPDTLFQVGLSKSQVHQAVHRPKNPHHQGGCNNPLHMRWGLPAQNRLQS